MWGVIAGGYGGAGERLLRRLRTVVVLCVASSFALSAAVARAEAPKLIPYGSFASVTTDPIGVAVDQSSGDVYVEGFFNESAPPFDKFDAQDKLLSPPSPFGEEGNHASVAVNPTNGDVYVLNISASIETYDPSNGKLLGSFPVEPSGNIFGLFTSVQIATDSAGDVYVPVIPDNEVLEYSPAGTLLHAFTGSGTLKGPTGVAVDASGNLWVADDGHNRVEELSPADLPIGEIKSEGVRTVALDGHGDVFVGVINEADFCGSLIPPCSHLVEYSSAGVQLADVGAGTFGSGEGPNYARSPFEFPPMLAVNESSGLVYVPDASRQLVWVFGPPKAPVVEKEVAAEVDTSEAKLGTLVNPGGIGTSYRFEYGTTTAYGHSTPFPEGSVGEEITSRTVWAAASGLEPGTTYHYRVVATNELGEAVGPDRTFTTLTAEQAACPNEELRGGFSARLPDCRAYELVTQPTKTSVESRLGGRPAADGDAVAFTVNDPLPGAATASIYYLARRGAGGWGSEDVMPLESYSETTCEDSQPGPEAYSTELSKAIIEYGVNTRASDPATQGLGRQSCNAEGLQVVPGEPVGYHNLLLRDNATGSYRLVNTPPAGVTPADAHLWSVSEDLSHVFFTERAPLAEGAAYGVENFYEWDEGVLSLPIKLNDGTPVAGSFVENSADGSKVFFTYKGGLYARVNGVETVQIDASQAGGSGGGGQLQHVSADGSQVLFIDDASKGLTADTMAGSGTNLYRYDISTRRLTDLTPVAHAEVEGVVGISEDGSRMYFVAKGVLAANSREYENAEGKTVVEEAKSGEQSLYMWNEGKTTFIATRALEEGGFGQGSPDGKWFAFSSYKSFTGYDNVPASGHPVQEVFLYSAASGQIVCASCNPSGEAPIDNGGAGAANIPDGGRIFLETAEALVPSDTNGQPDVYEYEDGRLYLISSGTSSRESTITGTSENGTDVFFRSSQQLVPQDTLEGMDAIYDARVDGGFPAPASPSPCTTADACRTPVSPQPSIYGAPSSQTFSGVGNLAPSEAKPKAKPKAKPVKCKRGFVKKKGKCVKKPGKHARKSARTNRRGK